MLARIELPPQPKSHFGLLKSYFDCKPSFTCNGFDAEIYFKRDMIEWDAAFNEIARGNTLKKDASLMHQELDINGIYWAKMQNTCKLAHYIFYKGTMLNDKSTQQNQRWLKLAWGGSIREQVRPLQRAPTVSSRPVRYFSRQAKCFKQVSAVQLKAGQVFSSPTVSSRPVPVDYFSRHAAKCFKWHWSDVQWT